MTIKQRVDRGVGLLDEQQPEWRSFVNPDELDLSSACDCVLGQVFDGFFKGVQYLRQNGMGNDLPDQFGFDILGAGVDSYSELTEEWLGRLEG